MALSVFKHIYVQAFCKRHLMEKFEKSFCDASAEPFRGK